VRPRRIERGGSGRRMADNGATNGEERKELRRSGRPTGSHIAQECDPSRINRVPYENPPIMCTLIAAYKTS
jgi:hypothetical protein